MKRISIRKGPIYDWITGSPVSGVYEPGEETLELVSTELGATSDKGLRHELTHFLLGHEPQKRGWLSRKGIVQELERAILLYKIRGNRSEFEDSLGEIYEAYERATVVSGKSFPPWLELVRKASLNVSRKLGGGR